MDSRNLQRRTDGADRPYTQVDVLARVRAAGFKDRDDYDMYMGTLQKAPLAKMKKCPTKGIFATSFIYQMEPAEYLRLSAILTMMEDLVYTPVYNWDGDMPLLSSAKMRLKGYTLCYGPPTMREVAEYLSHTNELKVVDVPHAGKQDFVDGNFKQALAALHLHTGESLAQLIETMPSFAGALVTECFYVHQRQYLICTKCGVTWCFKPRELADMEFEDASAIRRTHDSTPGTEKCPMRKDCMTSFELDCFVPVKPDTAEYVVRKAFESLRTVHSARMNDQVIKGLVRGPSTGVKDFRKPLLLQNATGWAERKKRTESMQEVEDRRALPEALSKMEFS